MEIDNKINFRGRKTEISYFHLQQEYNQIIRNYGNLSDLVIDLSFSQIKQSTIDRFMKDLFMIHEIDDERFQHKFHFLTNLKLIAYSNLLTNLDFIQYFFIYRNIVSITVECDQYLAIQLFNISKQSKKVEMIDCGDYFKKQYGVYSILSNTILSDLDLTGIEDQIETLNVMIESNNLERNMELFRKASILTTLNMMIISLQDFSKDFKSIIKNLQDNTPLLSNLSLLLYIDELIPPIKKDKFKSPITISVNYQLPITTIDYKGLLRKVHKFADQNDSLVINPIVQYKDYRLKLDFYKQILNQEDLKELIKFISKCNHKLIQIELQFSNNQEITNKQWVNIINYLGAYEELKLVKIDGTDINISIVALSVAKLMKCNKIDISIKGQTFKDNNLNLSLYQLSDYTLSVLCDNIFDEKSSRASCLTLTANQIMGDFQPLSKYLSKSKYSLMQFRIRITSQTCELLNFFHQLLLDKSNIHRFVGTFSFTQIGCLEFHSSDMQLIIGIIQGHNTLYSFDNINDQVLPKETKQLVRRLLLPIAHFVAQSAAHFEQYLKLFSLFIYFRKVFDVYRYQKSKPTNMLAFYTLIGPELLNNPYQVYTDLYYD